MPKTTKPKKEKPSSNAINVGGDVSNSVIIAGDKNKVTIQFEQIKTTYGLFTIPTPVIDFTGREKELEQLKDSFSHGAIITGLSGVGGIGKTELARKLAHDIAANFPDAQMNIDLLGTSEKPTSPEDAMRRLLEPFHEGQKLPDDENQLKNLYQHTFNKKKVLLLLDNAANATQVHPLIPPVPSAAIITSRQHFSLTEFGLYEPVRLDVLSPEKALEFLHGASPKLNDSPDEEVNKLAKLCGHLPLALRVAASLLNDRPDWDASHLNKRLANERTRLQRLKREDDVNLDVDAALSLSYGLLGDDLKKRFRELGIFNASFAKILANEVLLIENDNELDDIFGKLMGRSLLSHQKSQEIVEDLYSMHDLTRLYATQKLLEENEYEETITRHAEDLLAFAAGAENLYLQGGQNVFDGLAQFRFIQVHLNAVYERFIPEQKHFPRPQISDYWLSKFPFCCPHVLKNRVLPSKRIPVVRSALDAARYLGDKKAEAFLLGYLGLAYSQSDDRINSVKLLEQSLELSQKIGARNYEANALGNLADDFEHLGDLRKSIDFHERQLLIFSEIGNSLGKRIALAGLGVSFWALGDFQKSIRYFEQSLQIAKETGDVEGESSVLGNLGNVYLDLGNEHKAIKFLEDSLLICRAVNDREGEGVRLCSLGSAYKDLGDTDKSIGYYEQALTIARDINDRSGEGTALTGLGLAHNDLKDIHKSIEYYEQALIVFREIGDLNSEGANLCNLGAVYTDSLEDAQKGIHFFESALDIFQKIDANVFKGNTLFNLGVAYGKLGNLSKSIEYYEKALFVRRQSGDERIAALGCWNLGLAYEEMGDLHKAILTLQICVDYEREINHPKVEEHSQKVADLQKRNNSNLA